MLGGRGAVGSMIDYNTTLNRDLATFRGLRTSSIAIVPGTSGNTNTLKCWQELGAMYHVTLRGHNSATGSERLQAAPRLRVFAHLFFNQIRGIIEAVVHFSRWELYYLLLCWVLCGYFNNLYNTMGRKEERMFYS